MRKPSKNENNEFKDLLAKATQGDARAQYSLGLCYFNGDGVKSDHEKAVFWYTKAAEQGNATAQHSLGISYYNGNGVEKDDEKTVYWLIKAAEQGLFP